AREVVVACAREAQRLLARGTGGGRPATRRPLARGADTLRRDARQRLERRGDVPARERVLAAAPGYAARHEPGGHQPGEVPARGLRRDAGSPRELAGRQPLAAQQRRQHRRARGLADRGRDAGKVGFGGAAHVGLLRVLGCARPLNVGARSFRRRPKCGGFTLRGEDGRCGPAERGSRARTTGPCEKRRNAMRALDDTALSDRRGGMHAEKAPHYVTRIIWTGDRGSGTSSYTSYGRD